MRQHEGMDETKKEWVRADHKKWYENNMGLLEDEHL